MKEDKEEVKETKVKKSRQIDKGAIFVKIMAAFLAFLMVGAMFVSTIMYFIYS